VIRTVQCGVSHNNSHVISGGDYCTAALALATRCRFDGRTGRNEEGYHMPSSRGYDDANVNSF